MYHTDMDKQLDRSIIAERIEALLQMRDMSVAELSRASGVSESSISNILSGFRRQPRSDTVQKIAKGFKTSTGYLNGDTNNPEPNNAPPLPDYAAEVIESMRRLSRSRNYELLLIAQSFVKASQSIDQLAQKDFINYLLDIGDELGGKEETNHVMRLLQLLEGRWNDQDDSLAPFGESD